MASIFAQQPQQPEDRKMVDMTSLKMIPVQITPDSSAYALVGDVVGYHNGAVITCDSAVRYSDNYLECYGHVVINKDSTYMYGDKAEYNGMLNEAHVYSPLVKVVNGDAVLYTYHFSFNTLDNVGRFSGGGTMRQNDNLLESNRGYYYSATRDVVFVQKVEIENDTYKMKSDSVSYNMDTEVASFYDNSYIWNQKGEILSTDRGAYFKATDDYRFYADAYILTADKEIWADSLDYNATTEDVVLRRNIQIDDSVHKVMAFGDYGRYRGQEQSAMMTLDPSLISYDPSQGDSLFMRSDSMFLYVVDSVSPYRKLQETEENIPGTVTAGEEELFETEETILPDESFGEVASDRPVPEVMEDDSEASIPDTVAEEESIAVDTLPADTLARDTPEGGTMSQDAVRSDSLSGHRSEATAQQAAPEKKKRERRANRRRNETEAVATLPVSAHGLTAAQPEPEVLAETATVPAPVAADEDTTVVQPEEEIADVENETVADTADLFTEQVLAADSLAGIPADSVLVRDTTQGDSVRRVVLAYRNVKIYREDFQAVCDSLIGFTVDSTLYMYIDPVLWSGVNQITSDEVHIFTKDQQIDHADFVGKPMMSAQVDRAMYNQVAGKHMTAYFIDNEIRRNDVNGNAQTYYYLQDGDDDALMGFLVAESADITFLIRNNEVDSIVYRGNPTYTIYPMDQIPRAQPQILPGFHWEGHRKPSREEVFNRAVRPSRRTRYELLLQPIFPTTLQIEEFKRYLLEQGDWMDRNDTLSQQTLDYIESVRE